MKWNGNGNKIGNGTQEQQQQQWKFNKRPNLYIFIYPFTWGGVKLICLHIVHFSLFVCTIINSVMCKWRRDASYRWNAWIVCSLFSLSLSLFHSSPVNVRACIRAHFTCIHIHSICVRYLFFGLPLVFVRFCFVLVSVFFFLILYFQMVIVSYRRPENFSVYSMTIIRSPSFSH